MKRTVRPSRFQTEESEEPRPVFRKVVFVNPFRSEPVRASGGMVPAAVPGPKCGAGALLPLASLNGNVSFRSHEDAKRADIVQKWVGVAESLRAHSEVLQAVPRLSQDALSFLFEDRAASTLSHHLNAWVRWCEFARALGVQPACPSPATMFDFVHALSVGAMLDRGQHRVAVAKGVVGSLKFVATKLGLPGLLASVDSPAVTAWLTSDKWTRSLPREAVPLPLSVVAKLEAALPVASEDSWVLGCVLMMVWGGLRWSDAQRLQFSSVIIEDSLIRGWCWRTKTSACGMPFGVLCAGVAGVQWGQHFGELLRRCVEEDKGRDFLMARRGKPLGYTAMLAQFRRCLCLYGGLQPDQVVRFTLHSCKATTLSWAAQLGVPEDLRAAQGHHRLANHCVKKYGRDDVWPQIRCQRKLVNAIAEGWVPSTPLNRGLSRLEEDVVAIQRLCRPAPLTASESESEDGEQRDASAAASWDSDVESAPSDVEVSSDVADAVSHEGPWLLNTRSGWCHKAVVTQGSSGVMSADGSYWGLACRPATKLSGWYVLRDFDPELDGFQPCGHPGCNR